MTMLVRFVPESATVAQYDEVIERLSDGGDFPPDGCEWHVAYFVDPDSVGLNLLDLTRRVASPFWRRGGLGRRDRLDGYPRTRSCNS